MKNYFNENKQFELQDLTFDCSESNISIYGNINITRDKDGLDTISNLVSHLTCIRNVLLTEEHNGELPIKIENLLPIVKKNPFND